MPVLDAEGTWVGDTTLTDSQNGAQAQVTLPAPGERMRWLITGVSVSSDKIPTSFGAFTIVSGPTTLERIETNNAWPMQVYGDAHYRGEVNTSVVATLVALGAGVRGTIRIQAMKVSA